MMGSGGEIINHRKGFRAAIILAAGQGTRMYSDLPKVLHKIEDKPLINHVLDSLEEVKLDGRYVVVGYKAEDVMEASMRDGITFVLQESQLGTGHAVKQCEKELEGFSGTVIVLNGDVPGLRSGTIEEFLDYHEASRAAASVLTAVLEDPTGYGRIVRDESGSLVKIVEEKDASEDEKTIREINSGLFCFEKELLFSSLKRINRLNAQNEYYLTDVIHILCSSGEKVEAYCIKDPLEVSGVNTPEDLLSVERYIKGRS